MKTTIERKDDGVRMLGAAQREDIRFLAAIADIVRDMIQDEQRIVAVENFGRDEPVSWMAYRLTCLAPTELN
ncbi:MAG: hypothetical protein H7Y17_10850 [Chlorobia bacterium]|nr:hypothetical protein [Fimbriimonadaceae bacterium]